jgi:ABC-type multidrug transport system fused ATPase/permease subunit
MAVLRLRLRRDEIEKWLAIFRFHWWAYLGASAIGIVGLVGAGLVNPDGKLTAGQLALLALAGGIVGPILYGFIVLYFRALLSFTLRSIEGRLALEGAQVLQERIEENFFTKLVQINFKYIDQYYLQTQEQANKSFGLSLVAALAGLAIVAAGIVLMFLDKTEPAYVSTSAGILSEFIAAVFFYLYNRTILKMSEYHQKLVITQNISLALKIAEGLPDAERVKCQQELVTRLTDGINRYLTNLPDVPTAAPVAAKV